MKVNFLCETTRRQFAQRAITVGAAGIYSMAILTSENPYGYDTPKENKFRYMDLIRGVSDSGYRWFPIKGQYYTKEKSIIIYNIDIEEAKRIGRMYSQESIIFINAEDDIMTYEYWENAGRGYRLVKNAHRLTRHDINAKDMYSQISKSFKFSIPFFDGSDDNEELMIEQFDAMNEFNNGCLNEEYNKWFQTEKNDYESVKALIGEADALLHKMCDTEISPSELWQLVRLVGYINHSAFKVKPCTWDLYPDEMLTPDDFNINKLVYAYKIHALELITKYYIENGLDIRTDDARQIIMLREPIRGVRQITFHIGKDTWLTDPIDRSDGVFDGVKQAHRYSTDHEYEQALANTRI